jgi:hypothetical protein
VETGKRRASTQVVLCDPCIAARRAERAKVVTLPCCNCGAMVEARGSRALGLATKGRAYCDATCLESETRRRCSETMSRTNRVHASSRMRERNPMRSPEARARMSRTLRLVGHEPKLRGGNGHGPTREERLLAEALGWQTNVIVRTLMPRGSGYPAHYKVDVGCPVRKVAIEVDGGSHGSLKVQGWDAKKAALLRSYGWTVLRFTNAEVLADPEACAALVRSTTSRSGASIPTSRAAS